MDKSALPTIHRNGNDGERLLSQYEEALTALGRFTDEWARIEFHPRDYYVNGDASFPAATWERNRMGEHIRELHKHLTLHIEHIWGQLPKFNHEHNPAPALS